MADRRSGRDADSAGVEQLKNAPKVGPGRFPDAITTRSSRQNISTDHRHLRRPEAGHHHEGFVSGIQSPAAQHLDESDGCGWRVVRASSSPGAGVSKIPGDGIDNIRRQRIRELVEQLNHHNHLLTSRTGRRSRTGSSTLTDCRAGEGMQFAGPIRHAALTGMCRRRRRASSTPSR